MKITPFNIGGSVSPQVGLGARSQAAAASYSAEGSAIDRLDTSTGGFTHSAVLIVSTGAATGTPTSGSVDVRVATSPTAGGSYTALEGSDITQITNMTSAVETVAISLAPAERFLKVQATVAFVGGTAPEIPLCAILVLGAYTREPVTLA